MGEQHDAVVSTRPHQRLTPEGRRVSEVLTYARRGSRFTAQQARAWEAHHRDWVVPDEAVDAPDFSWADWFGREAPMIVEIGSGIGEATAALAASRPEIDIVAFEVWTPGVAETLARLAGVGATNVRLCSVDAVWSGRTLFPPASLEELWTFFPDPWHKARHHKRRLVTAPHAELFTSLLRPGGLWRLATDWGQYADVMLEVLDAQPGLEGGRVERWDERPRTRFERRGVAAGREIVDLRYRRTASPSPA